ncbi:MAG: hypothetical protein WBF06_13855 [Candidatus Acidiferrales bacterium]
MIQKENCSIKHCPHAATSALDGRALCVDHFILASYRLLDDAAVQLRHSSRHGPTTSELARRLDECVRATTSIAMSGAEPDNLARARLMDILLWSADLLKQVRRGPRVGMSVAVVLASLIDSDPWEETTKTQTVSRHGACVSCGRALAQGEVVKLTRLDTGQHGKARVAWSARKDGGTFEVGLELLTDQNLWGVDWDLPEAPRGRGGSGAQAR